MSDRYPPTHDRAFSPDHDEDAITYEDPNEMRRFEYSCAADKSKVPWDAWMDLWKIEENGDRKAFLEWIEKHPAATVSSTYPAKSLLLNIAISLLSRESKDR